MPNAADHYRRALAALPKLDAEEQTLLDDYRIDPLSKQAEALLKKTDLVLLEARLGAKLKHCDWGEWTEKELSFAADRFMPTATIGRLFCLSARTSFARDQRKQALDELNLALKLQSDSGRAGPWMARLVQLFVENRIINVVEQQMARLDEKGLNQLKGWLQTLPDRGRLAESTKGEAAYMRYSNAQLAKKSDKEALVELMKNYLEPNPKEHAEATWKAAGQNVAGLVKLNNRSIDLLPELDKILELPSDQAAAAFAAFETREQESNPSACSFAKTLESVRRADDRVLCRLQLLNVAIDIRLHGKQALGDLKDPYGRPIMYEARGDGFVLKTETKRDGEPLASFTVTSGK